MRVWAFLTVGLLLATAWAGCFGDEGDAANGRNRRTAPEGSPAMYDILPPEEVWVASTSDGQQMHNAVYRPDTDEPVPVWINFSPYWGDGAMQEGDAFSTYMIQEYVPRGYAVVLSAVRGTGHSEGCFQIGGDLELRDAHDVVDFFSKQAWSNGRVGAGGKSYDSTTQNGMIAKFPHPALKAVFHVSGITDMYRYNYREGVTYSNGPNFNTYYYGQGIHEYGLPVPLLGGSPRGESTYMDETPGSLVRLADDAACPALPGIQANGVASAATGVKTPYWIERDWTRFIADSPWNGTIFFVHGLQDWNVKPDHILPWLANLPADVQVKGWLHQWQQDATGHVYPMRPDWNATMLRWMDWSLKGIDNGMEDAMGFDVQGSDGAWRESPTWPPADGNQLGLGPADAQPSGFQVALPEVPFRTAGAPTLDIAIATENPDPVFSAILYDVDLATGALSWVNEGVLRGILAGSLETPEAVTPGETASYQLSFYPMDHVVAEGHALYVALGGTPSQALALPTQLAGHTYQADAAVLHVVAAPVAPTTTPQPTEMVCFTC